MSSFSQEDFQVKCIKHSPLINLYAIYMSHTCRVCLWISPFEHTLALLKSLSRKSKPAQKKNNKLLIYWSGSVWWRQQCPQSWLLALGLQSYIFNTSGTVVSSMELSPSRSMIRPQLLQTENRLAVYGCFITRFLHMYNANKQSIFLNFKINLPCSKPSSA